jgi:2'-5' RNA ligase
VTCGANGNEAMTSRRGDRHAAGVNFPFPQPLSETTVRLFFSLWPSDEVAARLGSVAAAQAAQFGGKPSRIETLHLTLVFLGEAADETLPRLIEAARTVRARAFELAIDHVGYWSHNRLLWAGSSMPSPELAALQKELAAALAGAGAAPYDAGRPFAPHVTLIRKLPKGRVPPARIDIEPVRWTASGFVLVRSELSASGASYRPLADFPLLPAAG